MRITWLLDPPPGAELDDLSGVQADALAARGHEVRIIAAERPPSFFGGHRAEWLELEDWRVIELAADDFVIATSPQTARLAADLAGRRAVARLENALVLPEELFRSRAAREHEPLRVLLAGASQLENRGIEDGYGAVAHARWFHQTIELVRVSPWAPSREEPLDGIQEYHVALSAQEMTRLLHSCDVVVVPSYAEETTSLIAAAAMAAGLACVFTDIHAHHFRGERDYALFAPARNAVELGEKLIEVTSDEERRAALRSRAREVAEQWRPEIAAERIEKDLVRRAEGRSAQRDEG
ncbi:MAG TPA: glycosyltransferase [Thermoanaerobaculia bacterium]|nr:glycosyltransferase [Thermoanaerobaculia bacterium]